MKAISVKAIREPQFPQILTGIKSKITQSRVSIAAISGAVCLIGALAGSDPVMYAGAFAALAAIRPLATKGGEK